MTAGDLADFLDSLKFAVDRAGWSDRRRSAPRRRTGIGRSRRAGALVPPPGLCRIGRHGPSALLDPAPLRPSTPLRTVDHPGPRVCLTARRAPLSGARAAARSTALTRRSRRSPESRHPGKLVVTSAPACISGAARHPVMVIGEDIDPQDGSRPIDRFDTQVYDVTFEPRGKSSGGLLACQ
jgi:hypothetical protein